MSSIVEKYVARLAPLARGRIRGLVRLDITDQGSVMLSETGAEAGQGPADVVMRANDEVFRAILSGAQNPVMAYMSGKLKVEGNVQRALKVSSILTGG